MPNCHEISVLNTGESGIAMSGDILFSILESIVILDVEEVIFSDNDGPFHLGRNDDFPIHIIRYQAGKG